MRGYQWMMEVDRQARLGNQTKLRELAARESGRVRIFCAHDAKEFASLSAAG